MSRRVAEMLTYFGGNVRKRSVFQRRDRTESATMSKSPRLGRLADLEEVGVGIGAVGAVRAGRASYLGSGGGS